jgi:4-methylaminobutanoate oxidase (formaldehyde-forming)
VQNQAKIVVIGGGITGCSVLYHLAKAGVKDVVLVEKGELTSGATCQAAGMLTQFNTSQTIMRMRQYSTRLYKSLNAFSEAGSVNIASSPEMLKTFQRNVSRARGIGLDVGIISAKETMALLPWASDDSLYGAFHIPGDGHIDPHTTTYAVAREATNLGAKILINTRVTGIGLSSKGEVRKVITDKGDIECEIIVNAAGIWSAQVASMAGVCIPCTPVVHQHIAMEAVKGHEIPADSPTFRDYEYLVYGRPEGGSYLIGGWEMHPNTIWIDGTPWDHGSSEVPNDLDLFAPMLEDAIKRFPFLGEAGMIRLVAHPDAFTPDNGPLLGPWPGLKGFWLAAVSNMQGFGGGGGIGKTIAEWITEDQTEWDVFPYRAWRFSKHYNQPVYAAECAKECYRYYYRTKYPHDENVSMRPVRMSPLHHRLQDLGAVFGTKNGWERANYFEPKKTWRMAGEDQRNWGGWIKPSFFENTAAESEAVRNKVGLFDMSPFGKIELKGPGALPLIQRLTDNNLDRPTGSVTYTQFLNDQGGIVGDVMIARLDSDTFRIITGSAFIDSDLGWIRLNQQKNDLPVEITDVTEDYAVIGLWGPKAREVMQKVTTADISHASFPYMSAKNIPIGSIPVFAQRVTYVGELGWELYVPREKAIFIWDKLWAEGQNYKIKPCGFKTIDSLRLEKGFLALGSDITTLETPLEARLNHCVKLEKAGDFIGKKALASLKKQGIKQRLHTLTIGDEEYLTLYGGEAVALDGKIISRLRSAGYGHTVKKNIGFAYLPTDCVENETKLMVEVFGEMIPAQIAPDVLYDPESRAIRS